MRGLKLNNPGNIERSSGTPWKGETVPSSDVRFAQFETVEYGYRALLKLLQNYIIHYNCNTIRKIITRWAPPVENQTEAYIGFVSKTAGILSEATITSADRSSLISIAAAITRQEQGVFADVHALERAWDMLGS